MRLFKAVFLLFLALTLVGCGTASLSRTDRQALKRVTIAPITMPEKPTIIAPGAAIGFLIAGALGSAIVNGTSDLPAAYQEHLEKNKIDINALTLNAVKTSLRAKGIEVVEQVAQADAVLNVAVAHGLLAVNAFRSDRFTQFSASLKLTKPNGDVIWKDYAAAHLSTEIQKQLEHHPIPDYFNDPAMLEEQVRKVIGMVLEEATHSL